MSIFIRRLFLKCESGYGKNVLNNYLIRIIGIVLGFINTRLTLGYLGVTLYGLWITITSVISWMSSGDLGIGSGLRNELALAYGKNDITKQKNLIKTAIICLSRVSGGLFLVIIVIAEGLIYWGILQKTLRIPFYITSVFFCINLVLSLSQSIAFSYQKSWLPTFVSSGVQFLSIIMIMLFSFFNIKANLTVFAFFYGLCTTIPNIILIMALWKKDNKLLNGCYKAELRKAITSVGIQFFGLQLCGVILYSTDNVIINYLLDSEMVTKYSVITKVYEAGTSLFSILLIALWSAVTYHIATEDYKWIERKIKQLIVMWGGFTIGVIIVSVLFNSIVKIWLGSAAIVYEPELISLFASYCIICALSAIFGNVVNGLGIIKLQLILAVIEAVINIPLSVIFAHNWGMGILGVKLATFICSLISAIAIPIQVILFLRKKRTTTM